MEVKLLKDDHLKQLGRITVNFQLIELQFAFVLWLLIDENDQRKGQIITSQMSFSKICDVLMSFVKHKIPNEKSVEKLEEYVKRASQLEQKRNSVIHSSWTTGGEDDISIRFKYATSRKKGLQVISEKITPGNLKDIADEAQEITNGFLKDVFALLKETGITRHK